MIPQPSRLHLAKSGEIWLIPARRLIVKTFMNRLLDLRTEEWPRLGVIYVMFFIYLAAVNWGGTTAETAFLAKFGVNALLYAYIGGAIITILAEGVYTAFANRSANEMLPIGGSVSLAVGIDVGRDIQCN